jgi:hypothetical protein
MEGRCDYRDSDLPEFWHCGGGRFIRHLEAAQVEIGGMPMRRFGSLRRLALLAVLVTLLTIVTTVMALPTYQQFPCFGSAGCPETVNPEEGEYYSVQCTTNAVWLWVSIPNPSLVTFVSLFQIDTLNDGESLVASNNVTVTRSGDTIILSGDNGNLAPQPGEKSFGWNECIEHNGGLIELPPVGQELTDEQIECMNLTDEQEKVDCLNALGSDAENCEDENYAVAHVQECYLINCRTIVDAFVNRAECFGSATPGEIWRFWVEYCFGPVQATGIVAAVVVFRRRKRK